MAIVKTSSTKYITEASNYNNPQEVIDFADSIGIKTNPINIEALIQKHGLRVIYEDLGREISGYIEKRDSGFIISINKYQSPRRQRFTLAHEFSHFILHQKSIESGRKIDSNLFRDDTKNAEELEANKFASELLMPEIKFKEQVSSGKRQFSELADYFEVSIAAARYRAYQLNYISKY